MSNMAVPGEALQPDGAQVSAFTTIKRRPRDKQTALALVTSTKEQRFNVDTRSPSSTRLSRVYSAAYGELTTELLTATVEKASSSMRQSATTGAKLVTMPSTTSIAPQCDGQLVDGEYCCSIGKGVTANKFVALPPRDYDIRATHNLPYYHGVLSATDAAMRLLHVGEFLLRHDPLDVSLVLSVAKETAVHNQVIVPNENGLFAISRREQVSSVDEYISYHHVYGVPIALGVFLNTPIVPDSGWMARASQRQSSDSELTAAPSTLKTAVSAPLVPAYIVQDRLRQPGDFCIRSDSRDGHPMVSVRSGEMTVRNVRLPAWNAEIGGYPTMNNRRLGRADVQQWCEYHRRNCVPIKTGVILVRPIGMPQ